MKKVFTILLSILLVSVSSLFAKETKSIKNAVALKPFNYSNINLGKNDGVQGGHLGLEYQRLLTANNKWTLAIPLIAGFYGYPEIMDYYKKGGQIYITPGIKYYPKGFGRIKGYSVGAHVMLGIDDYSYSGWNSGSQRAFFTGLFLNNNYTFKLGTKVGFNAELGAGVRYYTGVHRGIYYDEILWQKFEVRENVRQLSGVLNASVGFLFFF